MIDTKENAQAVVDIFNDLFKADPVAATKLFLNRVDCNDAVADHPRIIAVGALGAWAVGFIGLINGLFSEKWLVSMVVDDDRLSGFRVVDVS